MALRLLHFADTHIGVETYGRIDPTTGRHTRLGDFARCLNVAVDQGLAREVDVALFAGDAYRTAMPTPTQQQILAQAFGRLLDAGVPLVMVTGNHDIPVAFGRASSLDIFRTLAGQRVTLATRPELVRVETKSGPLQVACLPWPQRSMLMALDEARTWTDEQLREALVALCRESIESLAAQLDPALPGVLLAHITADNAVFSGSERMVLAGGDPSVSKTVLADPRFDYVALGHIHKHQDINLGERPPAIYSGSIERLDFGEAGDDKGVMIVTLGDGPSPAERMVSLEHVPLPARPFVSIVVALPPAADATDALIEAIGKRDLSGAIVRVRYRCTDEQAQALDLRAVRLALGAAHTVAGIARERVEEERRPRVAVTEDLSVADALTRYLDSRPELGPLRDELMAAGLELDRELHAEELARSERTEA